MDGRAHSFLVLPGMGEPVLVTDVPVSDEVAMPKAQVVVSDLTIEAAIEALRAAGLGKARVGLVGGDALPASMFRKIQAALPAMSFDGRGPSGCRLACREVAGRNRPPPGGLRDRLEDHRGDDGRSIARRHPWRHRRGGDAGSRPRGRHPLQLVHGLGPRRGEPDHRQALLPDLGGADGPQERRVASPGHLRRAARLLFRRVAFGAIGPPTNRQIDAFEAAIAVVEEGISGVRPGVRAGDVARAGLGKQEALGYPLKGVFSGLGHGIGLVWDLPWLVPEEEMKLVPGMVLNFERTLFQDGYCGDFEETVVLTDFGVERLTNAQIRLW